MNLNHNHDNTEHNDEDANATSAPSHHPHCTFEQPGELSDTWHELLGTTETQSNNDTLVTPSVLTELTHDPWIELLHARGVEIVDLQHLHRHNVQVSLSELEMEQALQLLQEYPVEDTNKT